MENYYQEILEEIEQLIEEKDLEQARALIHMEMKMPYIPKDVEIRLQEALLKVQEMNPRNSEKRLNLEEIERYLGGSKDQQLCAVDQMDAMDLRRLEDIVVNYLKQEPFPDAAVLLIDSCIRQEIGYEIEIEKNEKKIVFNPKDCRRPEESAGFLEAKEWIEQRFDSEDPSFVSLAMSLLSKVCFEHLPLSYSKEEGKKVAISVIYTLMIWMGRETEWEHFSEIYEIEATDRLFLNIN